MTLPDLSAGQTGHVALHKAIRGRLLDVREFPSIQSAIDSASGVAVHVPVGIYNITQTIQCKSGVNLEMERGTILRAQADIDVIRAAPNADIRGGVIDCSQVAFTKSAILFDGDLHFSLTPTIIDGVRLLSNNTGTGIYFQAKQKIDAYPYVFGVIVNNCCAENFQYGIRMQVEGLADSQQFATLNANQFSNVFLIHCDYAIHLSHTNTNNYIRLNGNTFSNIQVQANENSKRAFYCTGGGNMISNLVVWDWHLPADPCAIELTGDSGRNIVNTNLQSVYLVNNGTTNKFITPDA